MHFTLSCRIHHSQPEKQKTRTVGRSSGLQPLAQEPKLVRTRVSLDLRRRWAYEADVMTAAILAFVRRARKKRWGVLPPAIALAGC